MRWIVARGWSSDFVASPSRLLLIAVECCWLPLIFVPRGLYCAVRFLHFQSLAIVVAIVGPLRPSFLVAFGNISPLRLSYELSVLCGCWAVSCGLRCSFVSPLWLLNNPLRFWFLKPRAACGFQILSAAMDYWLPRSDFIKALSHWNSCAWGLKPFI